MHEFTDDPPSSHSHDWGQQPATFLLICRDCAGARPVWMPFSTSEERGEWAATHTTGTGHHNFQVMETES